MKFLVFVTLIVAAFAFPAEERRAKRSAIFAAPGVVVSGGSSLIKGPSGVIAADTGSIAASPAAYYAAPAAVYAAPYAGFGYGSGAVIVGPSAGYPGYIKSGGHFFH